MPLFKYPVVNTQCRTGEFIKKSSTGVTVTGGRILAITPWIPLPLGRKDVEAEISLDVLMCLRLLSEDRGLAVQTGSFGC